ncbi:MAG: urease accessory UreF family protein [Pseudomonadota bacterium]
MSDWSQKLHAWLSPAYPVGAFAYSHGLEWAIGEGRISDRATLEGWISDCLSRGAGRTDAILAAAAWKAPDDPSPAELARALAPSKERLLETTAQGAAFAETTAAVFGPDLEAAPYPVAFGRAARAHDAPLADALTLYLQAFVSNLSSVGVRLIPVGQTDGQRIIAALSPLCAEIAEEAAAASLDDIGSSAYLSDISAMAHETQPVRLFRT